MRRAVTILLALAGFLLAPAAHAQTSIRGTTSQHAVASSWSVPFYGSSAAGDLDVVFCAAAYNLSGIPSGWTADHNDSGSVWNGLAMHRVLDSTDISTGSVSLSAVGSYDEICFSITFIGNPGTVREAPGNSAEAANPFSVTTSSGVTSMDLALFFGTMRNTGGTRTVSTTLGSSINFVDDGADGFADLSALAALSGGAVTQQWTYGTTAIDTDIIVIVEGAGSGWGLTRHRIISN